MPAIEVDLLAEQNATFRQQFTLNNAAGTPIDLTGCSAKMQIRSQYAAQQTSAQLSSEGPDPEIVLGGTAGTISLTLTAAQTLAINVNYGTSTLEPATQYVYDLFIVYPSGDSERIVFGNFTVNGSVTRF